MLLTTYLTEIAERMLKEVIEIAGVVVGYTNVHE
jgi:hypothetical protein